MPVSSVDLLVTILIVMLSMVLLLVLVVLIYNISEYNKSVKTSVWTGIINKKISEVIVFAEDELPENPEFEKHISKVLFRNLFLLKLVESENKFSGAAKNKTKDLFDQYNLLREAAGKLKLRKNYLIARGIRELSVMDVYSSEPEIRALLNHKSPQVYKEAQFAMVRFCGFEGLAFLDTFRNKISEWQQLRMLIYIKQIPENAIEKIKERLLSNNETVIGFNLKIIKKFQLLALYPEVKKLLEHLSTDVRIAAVQTLMSLDNPETMQYLTEVYPQQPDIVKIEIVQMMKFSKDQCCISTLKKELFESASTEIKVHTAQALYELGHVEYLIEVKKQDQPEEIINIVKYALQEKVC